MERTILHVDMNNCYASIERALNPELRGKPVAVCGSTEERHGICLAKSYEAKAMGVKTGDAVWQVKQKCPNVVIVPPHFDEYIRFSNMAKEIYARYTNVIEPYGLDENWLDCTGCEYHAGSGDEIANKIRKSVKAELGISVSVGVSFNKIFAKLGSDMKKPDAVTSITREGFREQIWHLPVSDMWGCGTATSQNLCRCAIRTIGDLAKTPSETLRLRLGKNGEALWRSANGMDVSPVMPYGYVPPIKSIGHGITTVSDLTSPEEVWLVFLELSQELGFKLRENGLAAAGVQISLRDTKLLSRQFQCKLPRPTQNPREIANSAQELFLRSYKLPVPLRSLTVRAIDLQPENLPEQLDLFSDPAQREKEEALDATVFQLRHRFGKRAILNASTLNNPKMPTLRSAEMKLPAPMYRG
ncbi:MAG: DNA polymerase IV [Oscillospiraceae bacterium]